jgi:SpoVK/Ycf46/Vps4 family AAA+-type ATPase
MRNGFACLFYGAPGTGKTETVYQIARQTGRNILPVNVSEIKSVWVGETEKNIKKLFDDYRENVSCSEIAPILLFNEADALLGSRMETLRSVDKMENALQNIILQEMETLNGIMIATTNLTKNLDMAFERRFIYKIEFLKPSLLVKKQIWRTMLSNLSDSDAEELALLYDFSGGQIENIVRKITVEQVLSGGMPSLETIHGFCRNERLNHGDNRPRIGFN